MRHYRACLGASLGSLLAVASPITRATDLTLPVGGRVSIELLGSEARLHNTLSVLSPEVAVAVSGCKLEPAAGLGGTHILSEKISQRGCRVDLDADPAMPGIQGFAAGAVLRFGLCAQTDADPQCEFIWSSASADNADADDHLRTTPHPAFPDRIFQLNWKDQENPGNSGFNDLIAIVRINADSDGDGLWDDWETVGIDSNGDGIVDLDLPALGANPQRKNVFVEIDWMDCTAGGSDCAAEDTHNHRPSNAAVTAVVQAFADASVPNPDGSTGIILRIDVGNPIAHQDVLNIPGLCFDGSPGIGNFDTVKADPANFGPANPRRFAYHYALFTHRQAVDSTISGCAELPGNDFQVSLGGWNPGAGDTDGDGVIDQDVGTVAQQAGTLMHELGHNFGLQHGGADGFNRKPNYLSAMNYSFQMSGIPSTDPDGAGPLRGRIDYSRGVLPGLKQTNPSEPASIGDGPDRANDSTAAGDGQQVGAVTDAQSAGLNGFNDWANLKYDFQTTGDFEDGAHTEPVP
jgi:hypothetical protein